MSDGVEYSFGDRNSPALQPLAYVDDPDSAIDANEWLQLCVECLGEKVTAERRMALEDGVQLLAAEPRERRTMTALHDYLVSRAPDLADILRPYTHHGIYGHVFDGNESHRFEFRRWTMFDLSHLGKMRPEAQAPAIDYVMKRVRKRFDGRPTLVVMDEAPDWLPLPGLEREAMRMLDTDRKRQVRVLMAAQTPAQIKHRLRGLLASVKSAAASRLFGADSSALEQPDAYAEFGVTPVMLARIKSLKQGSYVHLLGANAREFKLNANTLQLAIAGSSEVDDIAMFVELRDRCSDGDAMLCEWLKHKRLAHLAKDLGVWPEKTEQQAAE